MRTYRATLEFEVKPPESWTITQITQLVAERAEAVAGQMSMTRGGFLILDSIKVAEEADVVSECVRQVLERSQ